MSSFSTQGGMPCTACYGLIKPAHVSGCSHAPALISSRSSKVKDTEPSSDFAAVYRHNKKLVGKNYYPVKAAEGGNLTPRTGSAALLQILTDAVAQRGRKVT